MQAKSKGGCKSVPFYDTHPPIGSICGHKESKKHWFMRVGWSSSLLIGNQYALVGVNLHPLVEAINLQEQTLLYKVPPSFILRC